MALHVDLIHTDWLAGTQQAVARVDIDDAGHLRVAPEHWAKQLPALDTQGQAADAVLGELHDKMNGTYVDASEPHDDGECPFAGGSQIALKGERADAHAPAAAR